jgi:UDP-glucose 4-epimerase
MKYSLVTGGAGFIGAHVAAELLKLNHKVIVLDDLSGGFIENLPKGVEFVQGSITDPAVVTRVFEQYSIEYVYHLAAYAAEGLSHYIKRFNYTNNLLGSVNLINESIKHKVKCFVFTSSIAVYGDLTPPMTEDMVPRPIDPYGIAKYAVELELKVSKEMFGLDYIIFRPHNVYGELQNIGDKYRNVIGIFMNQLMQGKPLTIFGDGQQSRAFSYVGDVAPIIARAVNYPKAYGEVFNIGADKGDTVLDLATAILRLFETDGKINFLEARHEAIHAYCDHTKARRFFDTVSTTPLLAGLQRMAEWAKARGPLPTTDFQAIEINEGLPAAWQIQISSSDVKR